MASTPKMTPLDETGLVLDLEDEESAALKSDLTPVVANIQKTGYEVKVRRQYEVNGLFEPYRSQEATLLVLKFQLKADSHDRITFFSASLTFDAAPDGDDDDDPYLVSFAPAQEGHVSLGEHQTTVTKTQEFKVTGSGQAPLNVGSLSLEGSRSTQREYTQRDLYVLQTHTSRDPVTLPEENVVRWEMTAASELEGVGDSITIAVLVRRARSSRFSIRLEVKAHVGRIADAMAKVKSLLDVRKKKKYKTLGPFGPAKGATPVPDGQTIPEDIDPRNLHDASRRSLLDKLAFVHKVEEVETIKFYSKETAPKEKPELPDTNKSAPKEQDRKNTVDPVGVIPAEQVAQNVSTASIKKVSTGFSTTTAVNGTSITVPSLSFSNSRAMRHRKMAALYQRLAQLHREEAEEAEALAESQYADDVESQDALA